MEHPRPPLRNAHSLGIAGLVLPLMGLALAACAPADAPSETQSELTSANGIRLNGIRLNGIRLNGIRLNGIRLNGIRLNGIRLNGITSLAGFADWFNTSDGGDMGLHAEFMKYFVGCALPAGQTETFTDAAGASYSWPGDLGLAPSFSASADWSDASLQMVSACLMAHVNTAYPAPKHIQISLRGAAPSLAVSTAEASAISAFDGVFFGNLFADTPALYLCGADSTPPPGYIQTLLSDWGRQCFFSDNNCQDVFTRVNCATACGLAPVGSPTKYNTTCTANGVSYPSINVYVPKMVVAASMGRVGGATLSSTCTNCVGGKALTSLSSATNGFTMPAMTTASAYMLDVHYSNTSVAAAGLKLFVNGVAVMNGITATWDFPTTGAAGTWAIRSIPVTIPTGGIVTFKGTGGIAPLIDGIATKLQ